MNSAKGHSFGRDRVGYSFRALVDRTIREQHREERRLAEQRAMKHQFHARNSIVTPPAVTSAPLLFHPKAIGRIRFESEKDLNG